MLTFYKCSSSSSSRDRHSSQALRTPPALLPSLPGRPGLVYIWSWHTWTSFDGSSLTDFTSSVITLTNFNHRYPYQKIIFFNLPRPYLLPPPYLHPFYLHPSFWRHLSCLYPQPFDGYSYVFQSMTGQIDSDPS